MLYRQPLGYKIEETNDFIEAKYNVGADESAILPMLHSKILGEANFYKFSRQLNSWL